MKTVFSNSEVFHIFASKTQSHGRNSTDSMSFRERCAYSYAAVIGMRVGIPVGEDGVDTYVLATRTWSPTTTEHQRELARALEGQRVLYVHSLEGWEQQIRRYKVDMAAQEARLSTANKLNAPKARLKIARLYAEIVASSQAYSLLSGSECVPPAEPSFTPAQLAETARLTRKVQALNRQRQKERDALEAMPVKEACVAWRAGERAGSYKLQQAACMLRVNGGDVETSHGASIPVSDAQALWPVVKRAVRNGQAYRGSITLGRYVLRSISANGDIVVGCHTIAYAELHGVAVRLGLCLSPDGGREIEVATKTVVTS